MRFLCDENIPSAVSEALRSEGHDVRDLTEGIRGRRDREVFQEAAREQRILVTRDRDFERIALQPQAPRTGVALLSYHRIRAPELAQLFLHALRMPGILEKLGNNLVVFKRTEIRVHRRL